MRKQIVLLILLLLVSITGCEEKQEKRPISLINGDRTPEVLIFDSDRKEPERIEKDSGSGTQIVLHPDMVGKSKIEEALAYTANLPEDSEISMSVLSKFMDSSRYYVYLKIDNTGKGGKHINVYIFHYDKTGKIYTASVSSKYVAPKETWILYKAFYRNRRDVKWVFKATRRK